MDMGSTRTSTNTAKEPARYWVFTAPASDWSPPGCLPKDITCLMGQKEIGGNTGYEHWQCVVAFAKPMRRAGVKKILGINSFCEPSNSSAAWAYVEKDDTAIPDTRFQLGTKPIKRNSKQDWDSAFEKAKKGEFLQ